MLEPFRKTLLHAHSIPEPTPTSQAPNMAPLSSILLESTEAKPRGSRFHLLRAWLQSLKRTYVAQLGAPCGTLPGSWGSGSWRCRVWGLREFWGSCRLKFSHLGCIGSAIPEPRCSNLGRGGLALVSLAPGASAGEGAS